MARFKKLLPKQKERTILPPLTRAKYAVFGNIENQVSKQISTFNAKCIKQAIYSIILREYEYQENIH